MTGEGLRDWPMHWQITVIRPAESQEIPYMHTLALNSGECFDFGMKNTSKVTDFYI